MKAAVILGAALFAPVSAQALGLEEAISLALERNEVAGIAEARVAQARAERRRAVAALLPSVVARGTWNLGPELTRDIGGAQVVVRPGSSFGVGVSAATRLLDPAQIPLVTAAARDARAQEQASVELQRSLAFEVATGYVAVLAAEAVADAAERRVAVAEEAASVARERLAAGLANRNDVTRTELALSDARLARTNAVEAAQLARIALGYLVVQPVEGELAPPVLPAPQAEGPADALAEDARTRRPDVLALRLQTEAADARDDEPMLRLVPSLDLQANWNATTAAGFSGRESDWNVVMGLTWEIYDGGLRYADDRLLSARTRELSLQARALERQVGREIDEALLGVATARVAAEEAEVRASVARQNEEEIVLRFEAGLATALEQADAIAQRFAADAAAASEALQLQIQMLGLRAAMGLWPLDDGRGDS